MSPVWNDFILGNQQILSVSIEDAALGAVGQDGKQKRSQSDRDMRARGTEMKWMRQAALALSCSRCGELDVRS